MTNDRELMQQWLQPGAVVPVDMNTIRILITALRERLAQPEQQAPRPDYRDWDYQDQLEQSPLDRMAENARELGLDYEPVQWEQLYPDMGKQADQHGSCIACGNRMTGAPEHFVVATAEVGVTAPEGYSPQQVEALYPHKGGDKTAPPLANRIADILVEDHIALMAENKQLRERLEQLEQKRPQNCGTSYCSCIECVMEPNTIANSEAIPEQISEPVALEAVYETIIQWDEGGGKRSRRELARRIVALYTKPQRCPNCESLEAQNSELDKKLAEMEPNTKVNSEAIPEQISEPLPCPFCGHTGLDFTDGSTYRWGIASCSECGATCGEVRREYPDKGNWHGEAIKEWNRRYTTPPRRGWVGLTRAERFEIEKAMSKYYDYRHECKTVCLPEFADAIEAKLKEKNA